jgi:hypothetical protein
MASVTIAQVENDLTEHLRLNLPAGFTEAMVKWPNAPMPDTPNNAPWLRATMVTPEIIDRDASNCYKEYQGFFVIDVFCPKKQGSQLALTTADALADTFNRAEFSYSFSNNADVAIIGEEESSPWYHVQVISTYQFGSYSAPIN